MDYLDDGDIDENQLQACFVLHRGPLKVSQSSPRRRNLKYGGEESKRGANSPIGLPSVADEPSSFGTLRLQAFDVVWGRVQKLIEDIIEGENQDAFHSIQQWICNRQFSDAQLDVYQSARWASNDDDVADPDLAKNLPKPFPTCGKQLHTALMFLGGVNPSDHSRVFSGLAGHLNAHKCHVARLTAMDFFKGGVGSPLRSFFRQLIHIVPDTTDMEILVAWHREAENQGLPIAIVIEDAESCDSKVLAEFLVLLSEWIAELPIVLVMGMATNEDAFRKLLPASTLARLHLWRFSIKSPLKQLEVVMRAVMIDSFCAFELSHEVVLFLYGYAESHDLTITSVMKSLKIACMEHFWKEPLSFLLMTLLATNSKVDLEGECAGLPSALITRASNFPSIKGVKSCVDEGEGTSKYLAASLWGLRAQKKMWALVFKCMHTLAKYAGITFGDLLRCVYQWKEEDTTDANTDPKPLDLLISKLRDMPGSSLKTTLEEWRKFTLHEKELNVEVSQILSEVTTGPATGEMKEVVATPPSRCHGESPSLNVEGVAKAGSNPQIKSGVMSRSALRRIGQQQTPGAPQVGAVTTSKKAEDLLRRLVRDHMKPAESRPFNEVFCFKDINNLKQALVGETRRRVHMDLLNSSNALRCECCPADGEISSTSHDTTLAYILSQEYGDVIRVQNWYQSFAAVCDPKVERPVYGTQKKSPPGRRGRPKKSLEPALEEDVPTKPKRGRPKEVLDAATGNESEEGKRSRLSDPVLEDNSPIQDEVYKSSDGASNRRTTSVA